MSTSHTFAVTGASGHLGRAVVEALLRRGAQQVIATTRTPESLADYADRAVDVRKADFSDPDGLIDAFRGATHLLMVSTHGVGSRSDAHGAAIEAAKAAGVRHIFYTSHPSPDVSTSPVAPEHAVTERIILESGLKYTILRNFLYFENLLRLFPGVLETGRFVSVAGDAKVAWLGREDCADVAAAAMLNASAHENKIYDVTGSRAYSRPEVMAALSKATGRPIVSETLEPEAYRALLIRNGLPEAAADIYLGLELSLLSGEMNAVNDVVHTLTGHPPQTLEHFITNGRFSASEPETLKHLRKMS